MNIMKKSAILLLGIIFGLQLAQSQPRTVINLNGTWEFDQTTTAFPPEKFTRKIPVPGLIHLAEPKIVEYDKFFKRPDKPEAKEQFNLYNLDYTPRYSWYRKIIFIPKELENKRGNDHNKEKSVCDPGIYQWYRSWYIDGLLYSR